MRKAKTSKAKTAKAKKKPAKAGEIAEKRAKAYADMESHVCDLVNMGTIAMDHSTKTRACSHLRWASSKTC